MKIKILENPDKQFYSDWKTLWYQSRYANMFNSPQWYKICKDVFKSKEILVFAIYKDSKLYAVMPLEKNTYLGLNAYVNPGLHYSDKSSLLLSDYDPDVLKTLFSSAATLGDFVLSGIDESYKIMFEHEKQALYKTSPNFKLTIGNDPHRQLSRKQKSKIKNIIRNNIADITHAKIINGDNSFLPVIMEIESRSRKKLSGNNFFKSVQSIKVVNALAKYAKEETVVDIFYFRNEPFVYSLGFQYKDTYQAYQTAFDESFSRLSPGKIMLYLLLERLKKDEVNVFDFASGDSGLKREYAEKMDFTYNYYNSNNILKHNMWTYLHNPVELLKNNPKFVGKYNLAKRIINI